jgi:hypothetical protein
MQEAWSMKFIEIKHGERNVVKVSAKVPKWMKE